ncbi:hypothetical protein [Rhodovibrio salinarum]|uniref:hypothetical protein n=1 Tax=Rhodovibrio salinarum TaxID=1087 RepID=UPI0004B18CAF|nr:hypothetical protein [Rhodovibrio salinarum]
MRAIVAREHAHRLEKALAWRLNVRRRELRDWLKVGGLATAMLALTAMSRVVLG